MRITVEGTQPAVLLLGGLLADQGHQVTVCAPAAEMEELERHGLRLVLPRGWVRLRRLATALSSPPPPAEVVLCSDGEPADAAQEGQGRLRVVLDPDPQEAGGGRQGELGGLCLFTAVRMQANEVELCTRSPVLLLERGAPRELSAALKRAGVRTVKDEEPAASAASFFAYRLLHLPAALCHSTEPHFLSFPQGREIARNVLTEGVRVLQRAGFPLRRLPALDPQELLQELARHPERLEAARAAPDRAYNPLLQSILKGEPPAVDRLNGRLVKMASGVMLQARWNWRLLQKLGRVVRVGFFRDPADLYSTVA